jgi:N-acetylglutamate synthase-like GNAT family acetyltransferase
MNYELIKEAPDPEDYINIRVSAGLSGRTIEAAKIGLKNSLFAVNVKHKNEVIGIGRVIGDGGCFFEIVDIAVLPAHQGKGVGKMIMNSVMEYIYKNAPKSAYVSLIADVPKFYTQFGFKSATPDEGMYQFIK